MKTHTAQTALVFVHLVKAILFKSRLQHLLVGLIRQVSALCFTHRDRHSWILLVQCQRLACCDGSTSLYVSTTFVHSEDFDVTEDIHFSLDVCWLKCMLHTSSPCVSVCLTSLSCPWQSTNPTIMRVRSASREKTNADAPYGLGRNENIFLGVESQE